MTSRAKSMRLTLAEIADLVCGQIIRGEPERQFLGVSSLEAGGAEELAFYNHPKYASAFSSTKAGCILVLPGETGGPAGAALIAVADPTTALTPVVMHFARSTQKFIPGIHPSAVVSRSATLDPERVSIGPGAVVMDDATIGNGSRIGANAVIADGVSVGESCVIMPNVVIREHCVIGNRVILQPGCVIGADGYGYEFKNGRHQKIEQVGIVIIEDDVEIGANSTVDRARFGITRIGEGTKIDNLVQIGHNVVIGSHCLIISQTGIAGSAILEDYVTVAAQVGIAGHLRVGSKAILAARTGVTKNLAGGITYAGNPATKFRDDLKNMAMIRRVSGLLDRVKALEEQLAKGPPAGPPRDQD